MIAERLVWEFETVEIREQLRLRNKHLEPWETPTVLDFEAEALEKRPPFDEVVETMMRALNDLGTERQIGFGVGPIPITAMWSWLEREGYDRTNVQILSRALRHADSVYLAERAKKASE